MILLIIVRPYSFFGINICKTHNIKFMYDAVFIVFPISLPIFKGRVIVIESAVPAMEFIANPTFGMAKCQQCIKTNLSGPYSWFP